MQLSLLALTTFLTLATAAPTIKPRAPIIHACAKVDVGKPCNAGFISGVAATGICTDTIINVEKGVYFCSVAATSTSLSSVASSSRYGDVAGTEKGKRLVDLRRIVERRILVF